MEVKLCHTPILPLSSQRFCLDSWLSKNKSFKKHFRLLTEKWRFQILQISKGQYPTRHYSLHMVKEGETLSSISKQYGVSVYSIAAANKNIADIDLVFCGQPLNIPSSAPGKTLKAKTTGYFLVLVPLIAFCIRCIIGAFQNRVVRDLRYKDINGQEADYHGFKSVRWKSALDDIRDPDTLHTGQQLDSIDSLKGETQVSSSEESHAYTKLEHDYQQFLSECGISKWGYWRGGSHS